MELLAEAPLKTQAGTEVTEKIGDYLRRDSRLASRGVIAGIRL